MHFHYHNACFSAQQVCICSTKFKILASDDMNFTQLGQTHKVIMPQAFAEAGCYILENHYMAAILYLCLAFTSLIYSGSTKYLQCGCLDI